MASAPNLSISIKFWNLTKKETSAPLMKWKETGGNHIRQTSWHYVQSPALKWSMETNGQDIRKFRGDDPLSPTARSAKQKKTDLELMLTCLSTWVLFVDWTQPVLKITMLGDMWCITGVRLGHEKPTGFPCDLGVMLPIHKETLSEFHERIIPSH